jgi:uncharacterized membrane protein YhaH (DUF805 family)
MGFHIILNMLIEILYCIIGDMKQSQLAYFHMVLCLYSLVTFFFVLKEQVKRIRNKGYEAEG